MAFAAPESTRDPMPMPDEIGGRYRPIRMIGKGGMGVVFEVEHLRTGQRHALKALIRQWSSSAIGRFSREARLVGSLASDHIIRVIDADSAKELNGAPYIVMELLEGSDLERHTSGEPAAPADVVEWLRQTARGLDVAHDQGIIHRDLKPENLFLTTRADGSPLVKILDFGLSKMIQEGTALTASDQFLGTPLYMSPEQAGSDGRVLTLRCDLYSLGLVTYKLLTGRYYWKDGSLAQLFSQILTEPMTPPSARGADFGEAFDAWFMKACDRDPDKRFERASEQVEALAAALGLDARPISLVRSSPKVTARTATPSELAKTESDAPVPEPVLSDSDAAVSPAAQTRSFSSKKPTELEQVGGAQTRSFSNSEMPPRPAQRSKAPLAALLGVAVVASGLTFWRFGTPGSATKPSESAASTASDPARVSSSPEGSSVTPPANAQPTVPPASSGATAAPVASASSSSVHGAALRAAATGRPTTVVPRPTTSATSTTPLPATAPPPSAGPVDIFDRRR